MQRSMTRIRTSHVGRLPPPKGWEDMPGRLASAEITDPAVIATQVTPAIAETVRRQVETVAACHVNLESTTEVAVAHIGPQRPVQRTTLFSVEYARILEPNLRHLLDI